MQSKEPSFSQTPLFVGGLDSVVEYRIPGLVTTNTGTLVAVCDARVDRPGDAINNIDLVVKRSTDLGKTWMPMQVIVDFPGKEAACDPCIAHDRHTNRVWVFYDHILDHVAKPGTQSREKRIIHLHAIYSDDEGVTWSGPRNLTPIIKMPVWDAVLAGPGRGSQTRNGYLLIPCYSIRPDCSYAQVLVSTDHGGTWKLSKGARAETNESAVVELTDGRWLLNSRDARREGYRVVSTTKNQGANWITPSNAKNLPEPCCQGSVIRYTDTRDGFQKNRLLFSNPADSSQRRRMTVRMSYDEGETWPIAKVIYDGPTAYSCLTVLPNGTIGLLYESGDQSPYERIHFAAFNLEWLTDGTDALDGPVSE